MNEMMNMDNSIQNSRYESFMKLALNEAITSLECGEIPVGCIFVNLTNDSIIGSGHNQTNISRNGTKHAEIAAIDDIILNQKINSEIFSNSELYVTCEPCIMCAAAIGKLGIKRVIFGCCNERFGGNGSILSINNPINVNSRMKSYEVVSGILGNEAIELFQLLNRKEKEN